MGQKSTTNPVEKHRMLGGKIEIKLKDPLDTKEKLNTYYTPGVAEVSRAIEKNKNLTRNLTWKNNSVAIISDGTAVLGLGNIGAEAALPVMEGKSMLFKQFAGIDAVPLVVKTANSDELVAVASAVSPGFGGINLEDIKAPECFYVEEKLKQELDIPVFHDDQHGTAIVVLAGLINACKVVGKNLKTTRICIIGAGAAGSATAKLLSSYGIKNIIVIDSRGAIYDGRKNLNNDKTHLAKITNPKKEHGYFEDVVKDCDILIGVSKAGMIKQEHIKQMASSPIVFAMANPEPEIYPEEAVSAGAVVVATGRSDFPNQVNNALAFPGIFRGALDNKVSQITDEHKLAAARAIADLVKRPKPDEIIPSVLNPSLVNTVASVIN